MTCILIGKCICVPKGIVIWAGRMTRPKAVGCCCWAKGEQIKDLVEIGMLFGDLKISPILGDNVELFQKVCFFFLFFAWAFHTCKESKKSYPWWGVSLWSWRLHGYSPNLENRGWFMTQIRAPSWIWLGLTLGRIEREAIWNLRSEGLTVHGARIWGLRWKSLGNETSLRLLIVLHFLHHSVPYCRRYLSSQARHTMLLLWSVRIWKAQVMTQSLQSLL